MHPHYNSNYLYRERWISFVYQIDLLQQIQPQSALEIGVGPGVLRFMGSSTLPKCHYINMDLDLSLNPNICADLRHIPLCDNSIEALVCCQVLEHIPFDDFFEALVEFKRVCSKRIIISLPDVSPFFFLRFPGLRRLIPKLWRGYSCESLFPQEHSFEDHGQHYWEIGKKNFPLKRILNEINKLHFKKIDHFRMVERNYWHFFVLDV